MDKGMAHKHMDTVFSYVGAGIIQDPFFHALLARGKLW